MGASDETSAFQPTVIENATLSLSQLDKDLVDEAIRRGLITTVQGQMVLESVVSSESEEGNGTETLGLMVDRGLIPKDKAEELLDSLTEEFVPGYRLGRELGRGAMGVVYEATQKKLGRKVALKVVNPALSSNADYVKRFKREAQTLAKLNHPNIVQLYDFGEANGRIFLALEFVEGEDVTSYMQREGRVSETMALQIVRDVALGLGHGHESGVIHRDVKPANLLLLPAKDVPGQDYKTKVTDFGLAREQEHKGDGELTQEGTILGTPAYMAPEQTEGVAACHKCDIYALGATLYHMLTGEVPFQASSVVAILLKKQAERLENPQLRAPELSSQAVLVLDRMLSKSPAERYQDYASLLSDLELVLQGQDPDTAPLAEVHSSLQLNALVQTEVRVLPISGRQPRVSEGSGGGKALPILAIFALLALIGLAIAGVVIRRSEGPPSASPGASAKPSASGLAAQPTLSSTSLIDAKLTALEGVPAEALSGQVETLSSISAMLGELPAGQSEVFAIRLRALVDTAIQASAPDAEAALDRAWKSGDYALLGERVQERLSLLKLSTQRPEGPLREHQARVAAAAVEGAGQKERALWAEIEEAWKASPRDVPDLLEKLSKMRDYGAFSPEIPEANRRTLALEASAPEVVLTPVPATATISLDGEEQAPGRFKSRLVAGKHVVTVKAAGYREYSRTLDIKARYEALLYLAPLTKRELKIDPSNGAPRQPVLNPNRKDFWTTFWAREAGGSGEWTLLNNRREPPQGLDGAGSRLSPAVVTNRVFGERCVAPLTRQEAVLGWSVKWQMKPFQGTRKDAESRSIVWNPVSEAQLAEAAAELRLLSSPVGEVAIGFDRGRVYLGLRKADGLYERWSEAYTGAPPQHYRLQWDGDVAEVYLKDSQDAPWRFFHSVRVSDAKEETLSLAVLGGRVLFTDLNGLNALVPQD